MERTTCLTCHSANLSQILNFGMHPLADTFIPSENCNNPDKAYPLICDLCHKCHQIQLRVVTNPDERYVQSDYSYTSSNSEISRKYWDSYAAKTIADNDLKTSSLIVEIGSNDGYLLSIFQRNGFRCIGIDPSEVMKSLAFERGVDTKLGFFTKDFARQLVSEIAEKPTLVIANNVFNHSNDPLSFAQGISELLHDDGIFIFELPYWLRTINDGKFDQIYHEHVTYFTVSYISKLFKLVNMVVADIEYTDYHGGSIRISISHNQNIENSYIVQQAISAELSAKLFEVATYTSFMDTVTRKRDRFLQELYKLRTAGKRIVCAGAAAKGNSFLSFYHLDHTIIDVITESSRQKIGKLTPLSRIPIVDDTVIKNYGEVYVIILSWNLSQTITNKLTEINPDVTILNPYYP